MDNDVSTVIKSLPTDPPQTNAMRSDSNDLKVVGNLSPQISQMEGAEDGFENENHEGEDHPSFSPEELALFESEMLPHLKSLYHFGYRLTNNEDDANDLVQDAYLKAFRFFGSYERGSNAKAWLFRILKNSFINNYRRSTREPPKIDYEEAENYLNTGKSTHLDSIDMREKIFRGLIGDEVASALNSLPVDFRIVIILCDIEEFTYEEIAKIIDIPIGTVRSRLHRARKELRAKLMRYAQSLGYDTD